MDDDSSLYCYGLYDVREEYNLSFYQLLYVFYDAYQKNTIAVMKTADGKGIYYGNRMVLMFRVTFDDWKDIDNVKVLLSGKKKPEMFLYLDNPFLYYMNEPGFISTADVTKVVHRHHVVLINEFLFRITSKKPFQNDKSGLDDIFFSRYIRPLFIQFHNDIEIQTKAFIKLYDNTKNVDDTFEKIKESFKPFSVKNPVSFKCDCPGKNGIVIHKNVKAYDLYKNVKAYDLFMSHYKDVKDMYDTFREVLRCTVCIRENMEYENEDNTIHIQLDDQKVFIYFDNALLENRFEPRNRLEARMRDIKIGRWSVSTPEIRIGVSIYLFLYRRMMNMLSKDDAPNQLNDYVSVLHVQRLCAFVLSMYRFNVNKVEMKDIRIITPARKYVLGVYDMWEMVKDRQYNFLIELSLRKHLSECRKKEPFACLTYILNGKNELACTQKNKNIALNKQYVLSKNDSVLPDGVYEKNYEYNGIKIFVKKDVEWKERNIKVEYAPIFNKNFYTVIRILWQLPNVLQGLLDAVKDAKDVGEYAKDVVESSEDDEYGDDERKVDEPVGKRRRYRML